LNAGNLNGLNPIARLICANWRTTGEITGLNSVMNYDEYIDLKITQLLPTSVKTRSAFRYVGFIEHYSSTADGGQLAVTTVRKC
jgi:hypothetical protein